MNFDPLVGKLYQFSGSPNTFDGTQPLWSSLQINCSSNYVRITKTDLIVVLPETSNEFKCTWTRAIHGRTGFIGWLHFIPSEWKLIK